MRTYPVLAIGEVGGKTVPWSRASTMPPP